MANLTHHSGASKPGILPTRKGTYESEEDVFGEPAIVTRRIDDNHAIGYRLPPVVPAEPAPDFDPLNVALDACDGDIELLEEEDRS